MFVCMYECMYVWMYVCMYECMYVCMYECMYVWMYVCMYVCMNVCMYVCMYVYMYIWVISKFLYPDSDEKRFHCVFTGLRLISSIAPTNLKYKQSTCEWLISIKTLHTKLARGSFSSSCWSYWKHYCNNLPGSFVWSNSADIRGRTPWPTSHTGNNALELLRTVDQWATAYSWGNYLARI